ncbi:heavy-metal-associated domain-containing protein [Pseudomonas sp. CrR25]|nr:heavy-metal-associated domain-containing protein [Pseudomonas sp. CrR25]
MQVFKVQGMSCEHCVRTLTQALQARDPAAEVQIDLAAQEVRVASRLPVEALREAIAEQGYEVSRI